jgi:hypothetical protein
MPHSTLVVRARYLTIHGNEYSRTAATPSHSPPLAPHSREIFRLAGC